MSQVFDICECCEKRITKIFFANSCEWFKTSAKISKLGHLKNFIVDFNNRQMIVLDSYGFCFLSPELKKKIFGSIGDKFTVGIDLKSGQVYFLYLEPIGKSFQLNATEMICRVPQEYLSTLSDLLLAKRPFDIKLHERNLVDFIDNEASFQTFRENYILVLRFQNFDLEIGKENYRKVEFWRNSNV